MSNPLTIADVLRMTHEQIRPAVERAIRAAEEAAARNARREVIILAEHKRPHPFTGCGCGECVGVSSVIDLIERIDQETVKGVPT